MLKYAKFLKGLLTNKARLEEACTITMNERCSAVLLNKLPSKEKDPGSFTIPCDIGQLHINNALAYIGGISLMSYTMYKKLGLGEPKATRMSLELADRSIQYPRGIIENVLIKVDKFVLPIDFLILDMPEDSRKPPADDDECYRIDDLDATINAEAQELLENDRSDSFLLKGLEKSIDQSDLESFEQMTARPDGIKSKHLYSASANEIDEKRPELKSLPNHLEYAYLQGDKSFPIIISSKLSEKEKKLLLQVLEKRKGAIAWKMSDIKGISPSFCTHKILMEDDFRPVIQPQRHLNPKVQDVVKKEIVKLLDSGLIYPISDSSWVSLIHVVPKKGGMTVVLNDNNELIPSRTVTGWRVCIDYQKLNDATRKDHFPLPFIDQMRMSFGLCNAPATFQRCMTAIFYDMVEDFMEVFMDDFSVFGNSFDCCLANLDRMLARCEETNLVLNWKKCHFMVKEGIVLGHKISGAGIEVDRAKIDVIAKLPYPTNVKGVRSFLGHAGFYRRFIKDFSMISKPMTKLLMKDAKFDFFDDCKKAFNILKERLTTTPIIISPDWNVPFELMCDASDFAVGAVLGQRIDGKFKPIYYASKTLNNAQEHYTTTEKELLAVVFSFDKFCLTPNQGFLLLQGFDIEIKDKKGEENLVADHLSRLENPDLETFTRDEIADEFPDEHLMILKADLNDDEPWSGNISSRIEMPQNNIQGNKYILVAVDYVSKWVEAQALPTKDDRVVIKFLRKLFARFGVPKALISDRGTHFCNSQLEKALQKYKVTHKLSTAYHPQTNGQTKVTNKAIKRILERSVGYNLENWSEKLDNALWAFRNAYKTPTGCTPFRLVYGKACHLPVEIEHRAYWALKQCNMDLTAATKNRFMELNELIELRDGAYENTRIYKERTKKWHDSRLQGIKTIRMVENQNDVKFKQIETNNGTEFRNSKLESFCDEKAISQNFSSPYTPEQNGVAERKNRTLIKAARTTLNGLVLSKHFWTEADHLGKFDAKADDGYFLGYSFVSKAFRVFNTRRQQIEETYHVTFDESMEAIRFINTSVDEIRIDDSSIYPPNKFLYEDDPSRQYQANFDISYYIIPHVHSLTELTKETHVPEDEQVNTQLTKEPLWTNTETSVPNIELSVPEVTQSQITQHASTSSHPAPQDRWSRDQHIEFVYIIGKPNEGMITRSMVAKLIAAAASECLFVDSLCEIEPKKVTDNQEKNKIEAKTTRNEHGNEKSVMKSKSSKKVNQIQPQQKLKVKSEAENEEYLMGPSKPI
ncbi:reverse transcriptase domain-containing protein [Tanacetum coccineum]